MDTENGRSVVTTDDDEHARQVRKFTLALTLGLVIAAAAAILSGGREYLPVTAWLLLPAGWGVFRNIRMFRHPEEVGRLHFGNEFAEIIAQGGLDLSSGEYGPVPVQKRLAVQDALDSARHQQGPPVFRVGGRIAAVVGTVGWLAGAVASVVLGPDLASAGICLVAAAGFGSLGVYMVRKGKQLRTAERILERQLLSLDSPGPPLPGSTSAT